MEEVRIWVVAVLIKRGRIIVDTRAQRIIFRTGTCANQRIQGGAGRGEGGRGKEGPGRALRGIAPFLLRVKVVRAGVAAGAQPTWILVDERKPLPFGHKPGTLLHRCAWELPRANQAE